VLVGAGTRVMGGTATAVPAGVRMRLGSQGGGVITSGRSGSMGTPPVSRPSSGSSSESILAEIGHTRSGLTATCAAARRQTNPSSSMRRNNNRSRRSRPPLRLFLEPLAAMSVSLYRNVSDLALIALIALQRWEDHAECAAGFFLADNLDMSPMCLDDRAGHV
jgi:hypothetical protein